MDKIIYTNVKDVPQSHKNDHEGYEYYRRELIPKNQGQCNIAIYEIPPNKSAYPYHYHMKNEESFYIISGKGLLRTPDGERIVSAGDFMFFPPNENGAHKLTNVSDNENLVYIDFDTANDLEVAFYPNSDKIGIWGMNINKLFKLDQSVDYYEGE